METKLDLFKWKQYESTIILLTVRWYLKYSLSNRDIVEIMSERGLKISHTTIMRWVHEFGPEIDNRIRPFLKPTNDSWRIDETYIKVKGQWKYLYRAVDSMGKTIDFMLSENRDMQAAQSASLLQLCPLHMKPIPFIFKSTPYLFVSKSFLD